MAIIDALFQLHYNAATKYVDTNARYETGMFLGRMLFSTPMHLKVTKRSKRDPADDNVEYTIKF